MQSQVETAEAQAQRYASYTGFTALRQKRTETVRSLAASRFDWSHALHEVARTIPSNAWLTSLKGTVAPGVSVDGGSTDPLRASLPNPAIEIVGCTTSQADVAKVMSSLRRIDGVERVSLSSSQKLEQAAAQRAPRGGSDGDCRNGNAHYPQFSMTLFFATPTSSERRPDRGGDHDPMTTRDRLVIVVVLLVAALAGFWFLALAPKRKEAADLQTPRSPRRPSS